MGAKPRVHLYVVRPDKFRLYRQVTPEEAKRISEEFRRNVELYIRMKHLRRADGDKPSS